MQSQAEVRSNITNRIIQALREGTVPWRRPWTPIPDPVRSPTNFTTNRPYQGVNIVLLWMAQRAMGYQAGYWATFNQWKSIGGHVRKGEKGTQIVLWKPVDKKVKDEHGDEQVKSFPILRSWSVFNLAQVEGVVAKKPQYQPLALTVENYDRSEFDHTVSATGAEIRYGSNEAAYVRLPHDYIVMPDEGQFVSFPAFAESLLHEFAHWSEHRVDWSGTYAEGELRTEMGACFMSSALGIPTSDDLTNHASYVESWLNALEIDPKCIFKAATAASRAADFILGFSRPNKEEQQQEEPAEAMVA